MLSGGHVGHLFFCTFSHLSIIRVFSSVHPPILFPRSGTEPIWALNITSEEPTQRINSEKITAGKSKHEFIREMVLHSDKETAGQIIIIVIVIFCYYLFSAIAKNNKGLQITFYFIS